MSSSAGRVLFAKTEVRRRGKECAQQSILHSPQAEAGEHVRNVVPAERHARRCRGGGPERNQSGGGGPLGRVSARRQPPPAAASRTLPAEREHAAARQASSAQREA